MKKFEKCIRIVLVLFSLAACGGENTEENIVKGKTPVGDGRVICYNDDGTEFFNEVGRYVNNNSYGGATFKHLKTHPDYHKGTISFTSAFKCVVYDW